MCEPVSIVAGVVGAVQYMGQQAAAKKAAESQDRASAAATQLANDTAAANKASATAAAEQADMAFNAANGKKPDAGSMAARNAMDAKGGVSGTMLTGPQGVDPQTLLLGKTTLLGG